MTIRSAAGASPLFAGGEQPARRAFGICQAAIGGANLPVRTRDIASGPFCTLVEFSVPEIARDGDLLVVAPLSGHFPVLARDLIAGLLPYVRVYVTDWTNVRHVPARFGPLGLEGNISAALDCIKWLGPGLQVLGLCQGGVPALAATSLLAGSNGAKTPAGLILIGSPIDPLANPTRVVKLLRSKPLSWFESMIASVPDDFAGAGRRVYPAQLHLLPLWTYLNRHIGEGSDTAAKLIYDDGTDPAGFPFLDLFTSIMDLDAAFFLENTRDVFHECLLRNGRLSFRGERADPAAIRNTALLTIEGERDDIAAPGQTSAAHRLLSSVPSHLRRRLMVPHAGHFSLFYGDSWRRSVLPAIRAFCGFQGRPRNSAHADMARI
jgi:poly(3-hydroxybutyrate) depolymerase